MFLREVLQMARRFGAFTAAQAAVHLGLPLDEAARRLDKAVEGGLLKAVDVAGVRFYYRDPEEAADVILGSVDLSVLPRVEREKLMRL
ncbi:transcriptional regulator, ArsR family [Pyrobaculum sp. WP30]|nr:transcriptional regulator, ArsR family [Pyrobaculum sp. WP30]